MNEEADDDIACDDSGAVPEPRRTERLLMQVLSVEPFTGANSGVSLHRIGCTSLGRAQLATALAQRWPNAQVVCNFQDLYFANEARRMQASVANLSILCMADFPQEPATPYDLVAFPLQATGDAEWTRDLLQSGHQSLAIGGKMWVATDNPRDTWFDSELRKLFEKVSIRRFAEGIVYSAVKTKPLKKVKKFDCEFAFRDGERLIRVLSRPGVFSHRHLDLGARALIEALTIRPHDRVLDLGCGAGVVSLAAAMRAEGVHVLGIDSNPRAVQCAQASAALNGLTNVQVKHDADGRCDQPGTYDWVVGNPPYFSRHRISQIFLQGAESALKPGGELLIVTKDAPWYFEAMPDRFDDIRVEQRRGYAIVRGRQRIPADPQQLRTSKFGCEESDE